jgi:hypothetical protein
MAADAVTHGKDGLQSAVLHLAGHLARALQTNCPEFPESCLPAQFALLEDVDQVLVDRPHILLEQLRNECLRQPDRLVFEPALESRAPILRLVEDYARLGRWFIGHGHIEGLKLAAWFQAGNIPPIATVVLAPSRVNKSAAAMSNWRGLNFTQELSVNWSDKYGPTNFFPEKVSGKMEGHLPPGITDGTAAVPPSGLAQKGQIQS